MLNNMKYLNRFTNKSFSYDNLSSNITYYKPYILVSKSFSSINNYKFSKFNNYTPTFNLYPSFIFIKASSNNNIVQSRFFSSQNTENPIFKVLRKAWPIARFVINSFIKAVQANPKKYAQIFGVVFIGGYAIYFIFSTIFSIISYLFFYLVIGYGIWYVVKYQRNQLRNIFSSKMPSILRPLENYENGSTKTSTASNFAKTLLSYLPSSMREYFNIRMVTREKSYADAIDCYERSQDFILSNPKIIRIFGSTVNFDADPKDISSFKVNENGYSLYASPNIMGENGQGECMIGITNSKIGNTVTEELAVQIVTPNGESIYLNDTKTYTEAEVKPL